MKATDKSTETPTPSGISRRTVVKGAAWAVPVIAVAGSVPAMAASRCVEFTIIGENSCKVAGAFEYHIYLCFSSICPGNVPLVFVSRIETGNGRVLTEEPWDGLTPGDTLVTATYTTSGQCILLIGNTHSNPSSLEIYFSLNGVAQTAPYVIASPPIQGGCVATTTTTTAGGTTAAVTTTTTTAPVETTTTTAPVETTTTTAPVETITTTTAA